MEELNQTGEKNRMETLTWRIIVIALLVSMASFTFGYDTSVWGGTQVMQPFLRHFGTLNDATGLYDFTPSMRSLMTSLPFLGKLIGTIVAGPICEKYGRKPAIFALGVISAIGVTLQSTAHVGPTPAAQFLVGRVINFASIGITIAVVPPYMAECTPSEWRGLFGTALQFFIAVGSVLGSVGNYFAAHQLTGDAMWLVTTAVQAVLPILIIGGLPFIPESPRWLLSRGRNDEALACMVKLNKGARNEAECRAEIEILAGMDANKEKAPWKEVFRGTNLRRTMIAVGAMSFQQITGQGFISQYGTVFYSQIGISDPFLMTMASSFANIGAMIIVFFLVDSWGRRPLLMTGGLLQCVFIMAVGGLGTQATLSDADRNAIVACCTLFGAAFSIAWAPLSYTICGEAAHGSVREKTVQLASAISVIWTFIVTFTLPYLLNEPHAALGPRVGFIYGSICVLSVIFVWFCIPEFRGLSLEQTDVLFERGVPAWKFSVKHMGEYNEPVRYNRGDNISDPKLASETRVERV